jgi:hypothetical protein
MLVLDTCEHVIDVATQFAEAVLRTGFEVYVASRSAASRCST